jgi:hypothetical protein
MSAGRPREHRDRLVGRGAHPDVEADRLRQAPDDGDDRFVVDNEQDRPRHHAGPFT